MYAVACHGEDLMKLGFARDPLARLQAFQPRFFEFFDLHRGFLVATDTVAEARRLELRLRRPLAVHRAPPPLTVSRTAGGETEWMRGASVHLSAAVNTLAEEGFVVHRPLYPWLHSAFARRADQLYAWTEQAVPWMVEGQTRSTLAAPLVRVRDALDAAVAFDLDVATLVSSKVYGWFNRLR